MAIGPFEMIIGVTLIGTAAGVATKLIAARTQREVGREAMDASSAAMMSEIQQLKDRVQVLEKLVTDEDRRLAGEIERLRDPTRPHV